jgi:tRNA (guanine37-N1)-methyltransferase
MRFDIVTIFPDYLAPLSLSIVGKARDRGMIDVRITDLRDFAHDRHRTVDDTPYGGGPGMVMLPTVWGEALDAIASTGGQDAPLLLLPTPSGTQLTNEIAAELARHPWLVMACGRYEGIDARVADHYAVRTDWAGVAEISIGDYVLAGGEAAALVLTEAIVRFIPGVLGNPESALDDSFQNDVLEGPQYTRPPTWRGLDVPEVLLSGDHARIAAFQRMSAQHRTAKYRPDLSSESR